MNSNCLGEQMITLMSAMSFQIAQTTDPEDLGLLAAFFTTLGDQLALLAVAKDKKERQ